MENKKAHGGLKFVFPMLFGFLMSNIVFAIVDFEYSLFREPFDLIKATIDFVTFAVFFYIGLLIYERFVENKKPNS